MPTRPAFPPGTAAKVRYLGSGEDKARVSSFPEPRIASGVEVVQGAGTSGLSWPVKGDGCDSAIAKRVREKGGGGGS